MAKKKETEVKKRKAADAAKTKAKATKAKAKSKKSSEDVDEDLEEEDGSTGFPLASIYGNMLDEINFKLADADSLDDIQPMSTGSLTLDHILGGGIKPAMYTLAGGEQSSKTTHALTVMAAAINANIPIVAFRDFEGSTSNSIPYVTSIVKTSGCSLTTKEQIFGKKNPSGEGWIIPPRVRYSASTKGTAFFNWMVKVLTRLPDKKMLNGKWYLVYEPTKENQSNYGQYAVDGLSKKFGKGIYIPAPDGNLQAIVIVDSWPAMNPDVKDEEEGSKGLGALARMFSEHLPRVKGYLASKKVALLGINQLREKPMTMGDPRYEPGGNALKFNSDARIWFTARALSAVPMWPSAVQKHKTQLNFEVEKSLVGGTDEYRYIHAAAKKNKLSAQGRSGFIRLWTKDGNGEAHGIDPVWDTIYYLKNTGQVNGTGRKKIKLSLYPHDIGKLYLKQKKGDPVLVEPQDAKTFTNWDELKRWILGDKATMKEISTRLGFKPMSLRAYCFKQMQTGVGEALYVELGKGKTGASKGRNDEDDSDEGDDE